MRKIIVGAQVSMDGVMQAPGGPTEDPTRGFQFGGWAMPYFDQVGGEEIDHIFKGNFDLLLGRKTYEIFAALSGRRRSPRRHRQALQGHREICRFALRRCRYELGGIGAPAPYR